MPSSSRLEAEVQALQVSVGTAAKNPFLPAPARDAMVQATNVISLLCIELTVLRLATAELLKQRIATTQPLIEVH
jgi:hypothetical protein